MAIKSQITKKENIERTATSLFKKKGYTAASMRDLASEIGVEPATLYSHIKSKEEILQKICFNIAGLFFEAITPLERAEMTAAQKLKSYIKVHVGVVTGHTDSFAVYLNEWKHLTGEHRQEFLNMRDEYEEKFREVINAGKNSGEFKPIDEKLVVLTILSALNHIHEWYKPTGKMSPNEIAEHLANLLLSGLHRS
jgi:TetR/AcrR family transcriptional regulator, cholesterol catabolism regulator